EQPTRQETTSRGLPIVLVQTERCPKCRATKLKRNGTHNDADGRWRYATCRACGCRFLQVFKG
ncbi:MAG: hypothetical protein L0Y71_20365, partial [Gemmataceae bacterium]|nr:hypothetical protein [Gemmataceae bacterium]